MTTSNTTPPTEPHFSFTTYGYNTSDPSKTPRTDYAYYAPTFAKASTPHSQVLADLKYMESCGFMPIITKIDRHNAKTDFNQGVRNFNGQFKYNINKNIGIGYNTQHVADIVDYWNGVQPYYQTFFSSSLAGSLTFFDSKLISNPSIYYRNYDNLGNALNDLGFTAYIPSIERNIEHDLDLAKNGNTTDGVIVNTFLDNLLGYKFNSTYTWTSSGTITNNLKSLSLALADTNPANSAYAKKYFTTANGFGTGTGQTANPYSPSATAFAYFEQTFTTQINNFWNFLVANNLTSPPTS